MDTLTFDAVARRAARAGNRRSLLGVVLGAVLAGTAQPVRATLPGTTPSPPVDHPDFGKKSWDKKDKKGDKDDKKKEEKKEKKQCRKQAKACVSYFSNYCFSKHDEDTGTSYGDCSTAYFRCCGHYQKCEDATGDACVGAIPY